MAERGRFTCFYTSRFLSLSKAGDVCDSAPQVFSSFMQCNRLVNNLHIATVKPLQTPSLVELLVRLLPLK